MTDAHAPTISVIMIVRDGERFIGQALDSIFNGQLTPDEVLVIDGGSTDGTETVVRSYGECVRFVEQTGVGIPAAYNQGIELARGQYIAFLSHDDLWEPDKLRLQVGYLEDHPGIRFVVAHVRHFLERGESPPPGFREELLHEDRVAYIMETLLARRSAFDEVGLFDVSFSVGEDVDGYSRAFDLNTPCAVIPHVLVRKRVHGSNSSLVDSDNNQLLLRAVRASILRKSRAARADAAEPPGTE
jgi:glycosyltransferase involved in cell wall biosynthesis